MSERQSCARLPRRSLKAHVPRVDSHDMRNRILAATLAASLLSGVGVASALPSQAYSNCTALHQTYPHGVGSSGASDHVRGSTRPVTNFTRNTRVYNQNRFSDRDRDGVACEKR